MAVYAYCPVCGSVMMTTQELIGSETCTSCRITSFLVNSGMDSPDINEQVGRRTSVEEREEFIREKFVYGNPLYDIQKGEKRAKTDQRIYREISGSTCQPKCPTCGSKKVEKMGFVERGVSIAALGLLSKKIGKSFKCKNCGMTFQLKIPDCEPIIRF